MIILLVDSNRNELVVNHDILEVHGHRVDDAFSADVAALKTRSCYYDAAIMEINLPNNTGMWLLETFSSLSPGMPVFILTEGISVQKAIIATKMKAVDIIFKPLDPKKVNLLLAQINYCNRCSENKNERITTFR